MSQSANPLAKYAQYLDEFEECDEKQAISVSSVDSPIRSLLDHKAGLDNVDKRAFSKRTEVDKSSPAFSSRKSGKLCEIEHSIHGGDFSEHCLDFTDESISSQCSSNLDEVEGASAKAARQIHSVKPRHAFLNSDGRHCGVPSASQGQSSSITNFSETKDKSRSESKSMHSSSNASLRDQWTVDQPKMFDIRALSAFNVGGDFIVRIGAPTARKGQIAESCFCLEIMLANSAMTD
ncbi:hypothetical protein AB6A40_009628 [Gnathostoma spinigerum]|uniref:Uncharacterized protein n=1 Tax=Gnathostoma spinigerum TaxID=75299 RepID=A0ABD6ESH4_9BILA